MNKYNYDYDSERVIELLTRAKGSSRSAAVFAEQAGVSPSSFCKVLGGYYRATERFIRLITSEKAAPQGGVTYEILMKAAGLCEKRVEDIDDILERKREIKNNEISTQQEVAIINNSVIHAILQKYMISSDEYLLSDKSKLYSPNETLRVVNANGEVIEWWMYYMHRLTGGCNSKKIRYVGGRQNRLVSLTSFFSLPPDPHRKISVCYIDPLAFANALNNYRINSYKGNLSLVLVDIKTRAVLAEEIVSDYDDRGNVDFLLL